ncbi:DUF2752 domain-containing protein [Flavobacterium rhizosphaerae]|uniref:DUF2752 domain-containing protein n=1 Tax=Flavobacterium rhizosphaerae TaxID=3163298 RepID=A0ABW8YUW4_9FLAO
MTKKRLYLLTGLLLVAGYGYLCWAFLFNNHTHSTTTLCLFKNTTGLPCPGCGSTRAVLTLAQGHVIKAVLINPLGIFIALFMLIAPLWLGYDLFTNKNTYHKAYHKTEEVLKTKWVIAFFVIATAANWLWNIHKGL